MMANPALERLRTSLNSADHWTLERGWSMLLSVEIRQITEKRKC
jgi:hypothetical protein